MTANHPCRDDAGNLVRIGHPSEPCPASTWADPAATACFVPSGAVPAVLAGVPVAPWGDAPASAAGWEALAAGMVLIEPPIACPPHLKAAAGAVVMEPDGRAWAVAPTNAFGGHCFTLPKGRSDGRSLKASALVEVLEETGLQIELTRWLADVDRHMTRTRFYLARRIGGSPAACGWESQAVTLAPLSHLQTLLTHPGDQAVLAALGGTELSA